MEAFHSFWTKPSGAEPEEFVFLTMILSALKWREKNGSITLVTDTAGYEYLKNKNALQCWDNVSMCLDDIPSEIDPVRFWAAGKLYALSRFKAPVVSIDTDFIVWENLCLETCKSEVCAIHSETLNSQVYPNARELMDYDDGFSWEALPLNTAFVYYGNEKLKNMYIAYAENIMKTCVWGDTLQPMVFAEQRLLAMVSHKLGIVPDVFSSLEKLSHGADERFTHLWGFKNQLRENEALKSEFEQRLRNRLKTDFSLEF